MIHECGKLRTDINIYHPMVRIHILDLDQNGRYVNKLHKYVPINLNKIEFIFKQLLLFYS